MIIFRTNASPHVGLGHLTRCRALAMALKREGKICVMVGPDKAYANPEDKLVFENWLPVSEWPSSLSDAHQIISIARRHHAMWLVLDDCRIDEGYQLALRGAGLRWVQLHRSTGKPLWADIVVNPNPAARAEDYTGVLRNSNARLLLGTRYAILRPEFQQIAPRDPGRRIKKILLTFGGGDDRGASQIIASGLLPLASSVQNIVIISGVTNPNNSLLREWVKANGQGRVSLHINPEHVAHLFASCDMAVMAGGTSTHEAACCGLPMVLITISAEQVRQSKAWSQLGAAIYLGAFGEVDMSRVSTAVATITNNYKYRKTMALKGIASSGANGAKLISKHIGKV